MTLVNDAIAASIAALPVSSAGTASGYGVDVLCFDDITPQVDETDPSKLTSLQQDCYHRLIQAKGENPDDLDAGIGLDGYLSQGMTDADTTRLEGDIVAEFKKDDRVADVTATVALNRLVTPATLTVSIVVTPADPDLVSFKLILSVTPENVFLLDVAE